MDGTNCALAPDFKLNNSFSVLLINTNNTQALGKIANTMHQMSNGCNPVPNQII